MADGIRQFTVGTGGAGANTFGTISPNSQARGTAQGVAKFTLTDTGYQWSFMPVAGATYSDTGSDVCNNASGDPAPNVSMTAPAANAVVRNSVALAATATDNTAVAGVQFKVDGTNVGTEDTTSPYGVTWNSTAASEGQHSITAVARDNAGQITTSNPVSVTVDNVPDTAATVEKRVNASSDDAEQTSGAAAVLNSTDLELVTDTAAQTTTPAGTTPQTLTFAAVADATVRSDTPATNYGGATIVEVDNSPVQDLLVKFTVTVPAGKSVTSAKLRLYDVEASVKGGDVYRTANTAWTEGAVTWSNAPAADATPLGGLGAVAVNTWYEVDVKQAVTATATYGFRMRSPNTDGADYRSKEGGSATAPQLVIVVQ